MTTYILEDFNQDLTNNTTSMDISLCKDEFISFDITGHNIMDTVGHDEEPFFMQCVREVLDLSIPAFLCKMEEYYDRLEVEQIIDYTNKEPSYFFKVNEALLRLAVFYFVEDEFTEEQKDDLNENLED